MGNGYSTTLPLEVFTSRNFVTDFIRLSWFLIKKQKIAFQPLFEGFRGNVHTPSIAHWKGRGRLPIRHNWTFFAISYGWDFISGYLFKSAFFEGQWVTFVWAQISDGRGIAPNHCWCQKTTVIAISCNIKISAVHYLVYQKAGVCRTDRRTDGRTDRITTPKIEVA